MNMKLLFVLLLLPGLAHAVVCKTVGEDGVASFTDVPAAECPQGSRIPEYSRPAPVVERAGSVNTGVSARQVEFAGYESIKIVSPEDGGTVRSNEGRVPVIVELDPGLQQSHFFTAYLDGKAYRGRYGSSEIELTNVDRGTHTLRVKVSDSRGRTLIESRMVSFTLHKKGIETEATIIIDPVTGDDFISEEEAKGWVPITGKVASKVDKVTIVFAASKKEYPARIGDDGWSTSVPGSLLAVEAAFAVTASDERSGFKATKAKGVSVQRRGGQFNPNYSPEQPDYNPPKGGISTTPGQTNPAFTPKYTP